MFLPLISGIQAPLPLAPRGLYSISSSILLFPFLLSEGIAISWPSEHQARSALVKIAKPAKSIIRSS